MSAARGRANQSLYLARIQLDAWREALGRQDIPAGVLIQAFLPAVKAHLSQAYGWFLLAVIQVEPLPERPPPGTAGLPAIPEGKALPGEIRELSQLESAGWLAQMLDASQPPAAPPARRHSLAVAAPDTGLPEAQAWLQKLEALFARMGDSLDEF